MITNELLFQRATILEKIGLSRIESRVLAILLDGKPQTARNIEKETDLRQPEVSRGTELLMKRSWIQVKEISSRMKGRPQKEYSLKLSVNMLIEALKGDLHKKHAEEWDNIFKLEESCKIE